MYCIFKFQHVDADDRNDVHATIKGDLRDLIRAENERQEQKDDDEGDEPVEKKAKSAISFLMGSDSESDNNDEAPQQPLVDEILELEFQKYCTVTATLLLKWWAAKSASYPFMIKLARKYLGVPSTSVASERVFSTAGNIVNIRRSCVTPEHVNMLVF